MVFILQTFCSLNAIVAQPKNCPFGFNNKTELKNTESSKKMDGIWNRYNLKSTRRIYTFGVLKCSGKFKVSYLP